MSRMSSLVSAARVPPSARRLLRRARTAAKLARKDPSRLVSRARQVTEPRTRTLVAVARLAREDPTRLVAKARRRARAGRRKAVPAQPWRAPKAPPLTLSATFPVPAERGYLVIERLRGFEEKDFVLTASVQDHQGHELKPGRTWKYSHALGGYYMYPTAEESGTVAVPFTAPGSGATRLEVALRRWSASALAPDQAFGTAWSVYAQTRDAGADPARLYVVELTPTT